MTEQIIDIQYRTWLHGIPPKRIKLDVGGWAGDNTWKIPQGWHCKPYADANTYGLDLVYPWKTTCTVSCNNKGICTFEGDFTAEKPDYLEKSWHPFSCFAPYHFGYVSMVDIKTPADHSLMVLPHPRVFSCKDGSTPIAVPGMLEMDWWPEIFFIVFKAPLPNNKFVFKEGDPIAQFIVVPKDIKYNVQPMSEEEATLRAQRQRNLETFWNRLCNRVYYSEIEEEFFDNKYKVLSGIAKKEGKEAVEKILDDPKLIPHWNQNPQVVDHREPDKRVIQHAPWTEQELNDMNYDDEDLNRQIDELLKKELTTDEITDSEIERLVAAFKMQKRKNRQERSTKLKSESDPKKVVKQDKQKVVKQAKREGEFVLGYKIEKLL